MTTLDGGVNFEKTCLNLQQLLEDGYVKVSTDGSGKTVLTAIEKPSWFARWFWKPKDCRLEKVADVVLNFFETNEKQLKVNPAGQFVLEALKQRWRKKDPNVDYRIASLMSRNHIGVKSYASTAERAKAIIEKANDEGARMISTSVTTAQTSLHDAALKIKDFTEKAETAVKKQTAHDVALADKAIRRVAAVISHTYTGISREELVKRQAPDCVIKSKQGTVFPCHRAFLAKCNFISRGEVFLHEGSTKSRTAMALDKEALPEMTIPYSDDVVNLFLEFTYTDQFPSAPISLDKLLDLWELAEWSESPALLNACQEALRALFAANPLELQPTLKYIWSKPRVSHTLEEFLVKQTTVFEYISGPKNAQWHSAWNAQVPETLRLLKERLEHAEPRSIWYKTLYATFLIVEEIEDRSTSPYPLLASIVHSGYPLTQTMLGHCLEQGIGVAVHKDLAEQHYLHAARTDLIAQNKLALIYEDKKRIAEAFALYMRSAQQGFLWAQYNLGQCYEKGVGTPMNRVAAIEWYAKAAAQGDVDARRALNRLLTPSR